MQTDVLIVGGGVIGVSAAYVLARSGISVVLVETGELCSGSSYGNAGLICPCHSTPIPGPGVLSQGIRWMFNPASPFYIRPSLDRDLIAWLWQFRKYCNQEAVDRAVPALRDMQRASLALYEEWLTTTGIEADYEKRGGLELFLTKKKFSAAYREVEHMQNFGIDLALLDRDAVLAIEPAVSLEVVGGIHYREDAHINPARFVEGLAAQAVQHGAVIKTGTKVTGMERSGNKITGVLTSAGRLTASEIVLAVGAWTPLIAADAGIRLSMQAGKGYSITMPRPQICPGIPLHLAEARMAVTPMGPYLRFGGTMELSGINNEIRPQRVSAIRSGGYRYLATSERMQELETWSGLRPIPPDGLPYIGRPTGTANLTIAAGHAMLGVSMGPITGHLVAELVQRIPPTINIHPFRIERF